jgi:hypothetical protein
MQIGVSSRLLLRIIVPWFAVPPVPLDGFLALVSDLAIFPFKKRCRRRAPVHVRAARPIASLRRDYLVRTT